MALDLHGITQGIRLHRDDFSDEVEILFGTGAPGGDAGDQDAASIGAIYMRTDAETDSLQAYYKTSTLGNSIADWEPIASKAYVDSIATGISWREPVLVVDETTYADITAAETAANGTNTVDGVAISAGDRILFTSLTTGNENVYIVSGSAGAWTFTEAANTATDGDALLVQDGTNAESQWVYDGTAWILFGSTSGSSEFGFIRSFIGKDAAGAESPSYSSTTVVTQGNNLEAAIGELDASIGDRNYTNTAGYVLNVDAESVTASLEKVNLAIGARDYTNTQNHPLDVDAESVSASLEKLNLAIGGRLYTSQNFITSAESISLSLDSIDQHLGSNTFTESNYISGASNLTVNLDALDIQLFDVSEQGKITKTANVTTQTVVDTIPVADAETAKWWISVENTGDATNRLAQEVFAIHDGTNTDETRYATVKTGANISGLNITTDVSGGNFRLLVTSTTAVDVVVKRLGYSTIN